MKGIAADINAYSGPKGRAAGREDDGLQGRKPSVPLVLLACLLVLLANPVWSGPATAAKPRAEVDNVEEYHLKAVYLYNFLHFVTWPERRCGVTGKQPREIAVIGENPFGNVLETLRQKLDEGEEQPLSVVFYGPYHEGLKLKDCCLLYISSSEKEHIPDILAALKEEPVLTVSDMDGFIEAGGMIGLVSFKSKVRWSINRTPAQKAGLRLSAKLLDIAIQVVER